MSTNINKYICTYRRPPFECIKNVKYCFTGRGDCKMLTKKQNEMITMLVEGKSKTEVARELKMSRQTICDWLEKEEIKLEVDRRRQKMCNDALAGLKGDTKELLEAVKKLAYTADSEAIRLQALNSLLDRSLGKATAKQEIELSNTDNNTDVDLDSLLEDKDSNVIDLDKIAK